MVKPLCAGFFSCSTEPRSSGRRRRHLSSDSTLFEWSGQDSKVRKVHKVTPSPRRGTAPKTSSPPRLSFRVHNPASGTSYRVVIRGRAAGDNRCKCLDYATNHLGTCKHIEFTPGRLAKRRRWQGGAGRWPHT